MDSIFGLGEDERAAFLRHMMQSFGSTYICLWSYSPLPYNCLKFLDGVYQEESNLQQASSSYGSFARRLFDAYCGSLNYVDLGYVPGFAFKNNLPYMETNLEYYLQTIAQSEMQFQFYQGAGIKTLVFMGCAVGEIELGFSHAPQVNLEMEIRKWFPLDFSRQTYAEELPHLTNDQTLFPASSSSISLDSIEIDCSSSMFDVIPTTSFITEPLTLTRNSQVPTIESEDAEMARAILAVLSASPTTTSCSQNTPPVGHGRAAFTRYRAMGLGPVRAPSHKKYRNMFGRAVSFYRDLSTRRTQEGNVQTPTQMHHVIKERRRREKLNESFRVLKTLLPQLSKKDKASVLNSTTEYLTSLKSQVEQLRERNHVLERGEEVGFSSTCSTERVHVEIERVSQRLLDLRVRLRSRECKLLDLVLGVLKMLQQQTNVNMLRVMQSNTRMLESTPLHALILRLQVEGNDFDECGFQEAVRRVVDDLPH